MKIGCVLLAAGNARRFGSNKLTAQLDGISLIRRAMDAVPGGLVTVVVSQYPEILALAGEYGFAAIYNDAPELTQPQHPSGAYAVAGLRRRSFLSGRPTMAEAGEC